MSRITTSADELKKAMDNLAPKPFGTHANRPFKSFTHPNDASPQKQSMMPLPVSSKDLNALKLKPTKGIINNDNDKKPEDNNDDNVPEFLRRKLKTPAERKADAEKNAAHNTITNVINREVSKSSVPKPSVKPKIVPRANGVVSNGIAKSDDNNNEDIKTGQLERTRASSVRNSLSFFEENDRRAQPVKPKPPVKPKTSSLPRNTVLPKEVTQKPSNQVAQYTSDEVYDDVGSMTTENPNVLSTQQGMSVTQDDDFYDDVGGITAINSNSNGTFVTHRNSSLPRLPDMQAPAPVEDELYDDVNSVQAENNFPPPPVGLLQNEQEDELYDDVETVVKSVDRVADRQIPGMNVERVADRQIPINVPIEDELYDDVESAGMNVERVPDRQIPTEDELYDDVEQHIDTNIEKKKEVFSPVKLPKTFTRVDRERLIAPFGLERWLRNTLLAKKAQLKSFVSDESAPIVIKKDKPEMIPTDDDELYEEGDMSTDSSPSSTLKDDGMSEKERKKIERERTAREKKEKKEKADKEKKEKKRKEKEYKQFQLNPDLPLPIVGVMSCCSDYVPKPKDKLDLAYNIGDEINLIDVPSNKCPDGKTLVQNSANGRIGYVLKKDFGIEETPVEEFRPRTVSLIPTEEEQDTYEEIGLHLAPPVPQTPRPVIPHEEPEEEEQLYEEL